MNLYGWSKHLFDLAVAERVAQRREAAAAMGGPEILQRVRPERISQGRDDERAGASASTTSRPAAPCSCSSRTATASPTATSGAISSMSTMPCAVVHVAAGDAVGVSGIFNVGTGKARSFRDLMLAVFARARREPEHRICRHAGADPRQLSVFHRRARSIGCARRLQWRLHPAGRRGRALRQRISRPRRSLPLSEQDADVRFRRTVAGDRPPDGALRRRSDARRVRLWRGVAHFAGSAGAGDRGAAQRDR